MGHNADPPEHHLHGAGRSTCGSDAGDAKHRHIERHESFLREYGSSLWIHPHSTQSLVSTFELGIVIRSVDTVGAFYTTLMMGLMAQWTFDPKSAPEADQLTEGLRQVIEGITGK